MSVTHFLRLDSTSTTTIAKSIGAVLKGCFMAILLVVVSLNIVGCPGAVDPTPIEEDQLRVVEFDSLMVLGSERFHRISIKVYPASAAVDRDMLCQIKADGTSTHLQLYDDGGEGRWFDSAGFADSLSGDHVPGDGIFTRRISSKFAFEENSYTFTLSLSESPPPDSLYLTVRVGDNSEPIVSNFSLPDSIHSGDEGLEFTAQINDSDGLEDISNVEIVRRGEFDLVYPMSLVEDMEWQWLNLPAIAAGVPTGNYSFVVRAQDYYLEQIGEFSYGDSAVCWLENLAPSIESVSGPDTVWIRAGERTEFQYDIKVRDDQGNGDLDSLLLEISRSKDSNPDQDTVLLRVLYYDIANELDSLTGDGIYVASFSADTSNRVETVFTFRWIPTDKSPQRGSEYFTQMVILEGVGSQPSGPLGSSSVRRERSAAYRPIR